MNKRQSEMIKTIAEGFNLKNWQTAIREVSESKAEKVPKGWITSNEFAEMMGLSRSHAGKCAKALVDANKAERKTFRILTENKICPVKHYRLK